MSMSHLLPLVFDQAYEGTRIWGIVFEHSLKIVTDGVCRASKFGDFGDDSAMIHKVVKKDELSFSHYSHLRRRTGRSLLVYTSRRPCSIRAIKSATSDRCSAISRPFMTRSTKAVLYCVPSTGRTSNSWVLTYSASEVTKDAKRVTARSSGGLCANATSMGRVLADATTVSIVDGNCAAKHR